MSPNVKNSIVAIALLTLAAPAFSQTDSQPAGSGQSQGSADSGQQFGSASYGSTSRNSEGFGTAGFGGGSNPTKSDGGDQVQVENANGQTTQCRPWIDQNCKAQ